MGTTRRLKILQKVLSASLVVISLVGCVGGSGKPATVEIRVSTTDLLAKRFIVNLGTSDNAVLLVGGDSVEIDVSDDWGQGTKLPFAIETSYVPDKDPILNSMFGNWSIGELTLTGSNWDIPLVLNFGEATIWSDEGSWAQVSKAPISRKVETLGTQSVEWRKFSMEFSSFQETFEQIRDETLGYPLGLCSISDNDVRTWEDFGVWTTRCWAEYETDYIPKWNQISNQATLFASASLIDAISDISELLERLSTGFRRAEFTNSRAELEKARIENEVSWQKLFPALTSVNRESIVLKARVKKSLQRLKDEMNSNSVKAP